MDERQIIKFGKVFKLFHTDYISKVLAPKNNIRVALTHYVKPGDMENFDSIICYLCNVRRFIIPDDFFRYYTTGIKNCVSEKMLLMTFDDGLYSSYLAAKKVLSKYNIRAIFFIPTKILEFKNKRQMLESAYERLNQKGHLHEAEYVTMSKENIIELKKDGHWILPHTHSHCNVSDITTEESVYSELVKPKHLLEEFFKEKITSFAFPYGTERDMNAFSFCRIRDIYKTCFSAITGINHHKTDCYYFHRDCIQAHYPLFHVKNVINGVFDIYYKIKMRRLKARTQGRRSC